MPIPNNDPYFGQLPPPDQDPNAVAMNQQAGGPQQNPGSTNPFELILQHMITQNLGQAPPPERKLNNWEIFGALMHPELMKSVMARKQDTPQQQQYAAGQKVLPSVLQAYGAEQGRIGTENRFQHGQAGIQGRFDQRLAWQQRLQPITRPGVGPSGEPTTETYMYDPMTHMFFRPDTMEPVNIGSISKPLGVTNYAGPQGENVQKPSSIVPGAPLTAQSQVIPPNNTGTGHTPAPTSGSGIPGGLANNLRPLPHTKITRDTHAAPPGPSSQVAERTAFAIGLDPLIGLQKRANKSQVGMFGNPQLSGDPTTGFGMLPLIGQNIVDYASRNAKLQPALQGNVPTQDVVNYNVNMRPALYAYTKSQTGAQFSYQEFENYRGSFPTSMDDEYTATEKIGSLLRIARADVIAKNQQFHGIEVDPRFTKYVGRVMPRGNFHQLTAEDRIAYVAGGGTVQE